MDIKTRLQLLKNESSSKEDNIKFCKKRSCPYGPCELRKPTNVYTHFWIHEEDPNIAMTCSNPEYKDGHWMMFFDSSIINEKWQEAMNLYRQGKLTGIQAMKVSTVRENFFSTGTGSHVIIFYCGPSDDKDLVMIAGQNLLQKIEYKNLYGAMFYTDVQTFLLSQATGDMSSCKYKIDVPKPWPSEQGKHTLHQISGDYFTYISK